MGIGDELMRAGEAARRGGLAPDSRFLMLNKRGEPMWNDVWTGHPFIVRPGEPHTATMGFTENRTRDYIISESKTRRYFREYEPRPAPITLTRRAREFARRAEGCVVINPTIKVGAPVNKQWPIAKWERLVRENPDVRWLRIGESGAHIPGAIRLHTGDIFNAFGALSGALAVVCHEGALHHAAAALRVPCVVIRGGFISNRVTGYEGQADLYVEDDRYPLGCGMRVPCEHCRDAMQSITPDAVMRALRSLLPQAVAA